MFLSKSRKIAVQIGKQFYEHKKSKQHVLDHFRFISKPVIGLDIADIHKKYRLQSQFMK